MKIMKNRLSLLMILLFTTGCPQETYRTFPEKQQLREAAEERGYTAETVITIPPIYFDSRDYGTSDKIFAYFEDYFTIEGAPRDSSGQLHSYITLEAKGITGFERVYIHFDGPQDYTAFTPVCDSYINPQLFRGVIRGSGRGDHSNKITIDLSIIGGIKSAMNEGDYVDFTIKTYAYDGYIRGAHKYTHKLRIQYKEAFPPPSS